MSAIDQKFSEVAEPFNRTTLELKFLYPYRIFNRTGTFNRTTLEFLPAERM